MKHLKKYKNLIMITAIFGGLSFYTFNCAPPAFQIADEGSLMMSSTGDIIPLDNPLLDTSVATSQALLTSEQMYETMMTLTDQKATANNRQIQEFEARTGSLSVNPELNKINSPMMIAMASFSGEVCDGLVTREQNLVAANRQYFQSIAFGTNITALTDADYINAVTRLSSAMWGRAPSSEELALFTQFKADYIAAPLRTVAPVETAQSVAEKTRGLILATCAAVLSSFDIYTY